MCNKRPFLAKRQAGISLIELLMFIVIVSVAVAGVLAAFNMSVKRSADPLVRKQAIAIAESMLDEIQLMPFTFCDPDDANATSATGAFVGVGGCATTVEVIGTEGAETRYATGGLQFDNVSDYHNYDTSVEATTGIKDISGAVVAPLAAYNVAVTVAPTALGGIAATESLLVTVTVTGPGGTNIQLQGYRTRYAPNSTP